jgi:flavin reductase (DIM6/NTAB) family NADH-FMN oxidoreductase RutF
MNASDVSTGSASSTMAEDGTRAIAGVSCIDPSLGPDQRRAFRDTLGQFATGVTILTTLSAAGEPIGMTVNSFSSLSLDPPLILWSVAKTATGFGNFQVGEPFAVNMMSHDQQALSLQMAKSSGDKFQGVAYVRGMGGVPLLTDCVAHLECITEARYPGGDHEIVIGRVRRLFNIGGAPLLFYRGKFQLLQADVAASG